ncbi:MAG: TolC family protein, partial [Burkholderiales bacterium]|nr:TolC family protein [Burkholderiales bacterium]
LELAARRSLAALMPLTALTLAELQSLLGPLRELPPVPPAPAAGLPGDLLRRRPDLRAAERERAAASADVGVAVAARYPRFSLLGQGGWQSVHSGRVLDPASLFWSAGPQLSLPLFEGGRLQAQVRANEAALAAADAAWRKAALAALADAEVALARVAHDETRRAELLRAQQHEADLYALVQARWRAGDASRLELIDARRALQQQQEQTVQAQGDSLTALVALVKALGGAASD